ncbi:hypothetical protein GDO81_008723 [Engystomops pustulosus]|uniref:Uncharacterized protein n=1 Tax=Engystomops pustulosus TaxID=76066 RepID=A0AAV7CHI9_ENGPU|nr:hypothetical protein GDO81_008723 [Engystomops pustulosus]
MRNMEVCFPDGVLKLRDLGSFASLNSQPVLSCAAILYQMDSANSTGAYKSSAHLSCSSVSGFSTGTYLMLRTVRPTVVKGKTIKQYAIKVLTQH